MRRASSSANQSIIRNASCSSIPGIFRFEGRHQVIEEVVFEGGMVNPRVHDFLRIIPQPRNSQ